MAITDKEQGVWDVDQVYNKINEGDIWSYTGARGLYMSGPNRYGRLGLNEPGGSSATKYSSPTQVGSDTNWFEGSFGDGNHVSAMAQKTDGSVWSWGDSGTWGASGRNVRGAGGPANRSSPVQIFAGPGEVGSLASSGYKNAMYRKSNGELWAWGQGNLGQLGQNDRINRSSPVQVGTDTTWSNNIWSGGYNAMAVKTDGTLWTWGANHTPDYQGVLGQGNTTRYSSPTQVGTDTTWATEKNKGCSGTADMACIKTDGTLWTWGKNRDGVLGHNNETSYSSPRQVPGSYSKVTIGTGGQCGVIKTDGTLWAWGGNTYGNLGQNNRTKYSSPRQIGTDTDWAKIFGQGPYGASALAAIKTDKTLYAWGQQAVAGVPNGILGHNDGVRYSSPVQIPGTWKHASIGQYLAGYISEL